MRVLISSVGVRIIEVQHPDELPISGEIFCPDNFMAVFNRMNNNFNFSKNGMKVDRPAMTPEELFNWLKEEPI